MDANLYLSLIPEALVASMLPAEEFGKYLAVGTHKRLRGEAMFFEVDPEKCGDAFALDRAAERCVPHPDGSPKHTVYLGVYRVLERIPLHALGSLYLVTRDGQVLRIDEAPLPVFEERNRFLYDEICPVHPLIASSLNPEEFVRFTTNGRSPLHVPRVVFARLDPKAFEDPCGAWGSSLRSLSEWIDACFQELEKPGKQTKTVDRTHLLACRWNRILDGYYVGDASDLKFYPFPSHDAMEREHHAWWRSATMPD